MLELTHGFNTVLTKIELLLFKLKEKTARNALEVNLKLLQRRFYNLSNYYYLSNKRASLRLVPLNDVIEKVNSLCKSVKLNSKIQEEVTMSVDQEVFILALQELNIFESLFGGGSAHVDFTKVKDGIVVNVIDISNIVDLTDEKDLMEEQKLRWDNILKAFQLSGGKVLKSVDKSKVKYQFKIS
ncbi:MAG: hypothetical protein QG570_251 [Patescibacteria group bacterium]|nr:hypothetical protein [Patescibacteria group bacterium]